MFRRDEHILRELLYSYEESIHIAYMLEMTYEPPHEKEHVERKRHIYIRDIEAIYKRDTYTFYIELFT